MKNLPQLTWVRPQSSSLKPCGMKRLGPMLLLSKATKTGCTSCFRASQVGRVVGRRENGKRRAMGGGAISKAHAVQAGRPELECPEPHKAVCNCRDGKSRVPMTRWEAGDRRIPRNSGQLSLAWLQRTTKTSQTQ